MKYTPEICNHCGQTTEYAIALDKGTAWTVVAIAQAVASSGTNRVKLSEIVVLKRDYPDVRQRSIAGKITPEQSGNISRPRYNGLLAALRDEPNVYVLTKKGAAFLRGEPVPRVAVIDKVTGTKKQYLNETDDTVTLHELIGASSIPFWEGEQAKLNKAAAYTDAFLETNPTLF